LLISDTDELFRISLTVASYQHYASDWNLEDWKMTDNKDNKAVVEIAGLE